MKEDRNARRDGWFAKNRLDGYLFAERSCLHVLAGDRLLAPTGSTVCEGANCSISQGPALDHAEPFLKAGRTSPASYAGFVAASYLSVDEIREEIGWIVDGFSLAVRIGDPRDEWYGSDTTPVLVWNPRRIDLS